MAANKKHDDMKLSELREHIAKVRSRAFGMANEFAEEEGEVAQDLQKMYRQDFDKYCELEARIDFLLIELDLEDGN